MHVYNAQSKSSFQHCIKQGRSHEQHLHQASSKKRNAPNGYNNKGDNVQTSLESSQLTTRNGAY